MQAVLRVNRLQELTEVRDQGIIFTLIKLKQNYFVICALPSLLPLYAWAAGICIIKILKEKRQHSLLILV